MYAWPTYPAIDGSHGNYWVAHLIDSASTYVNEEYDLIEFFYACGIPSGRDEGGRDIIHCHPNFHSYPWERWSWHNWVMVCWESEEEDNVEYQ